MTNIMEVLNEHSDWAFSLKGGGVVLCIGCDWSQEITDIDPAAVVFRNHQADAIAAAGYRPPAVVISSENGLEALPDGIVVLDADGDVYRKGFSGGRTCWMQAGPQGRFRTVALPATVLHEPKESE